MEGGQTDCICIYLQLHRICTESAQRWIPGVSYLEGALQQQQLASLGLGTYGVTSLPKVRWSGLT